MTSHLIKLLVCALSICALGGQGTAEEKAVQINRGVPNFLRKVTEDKTAHVAFLGGSITQAKHGHSAMVPAYLTKTFPDCKFTFTNAGLGSTCSTSGAFRLKDHVLKKGTIDLLILEFAVNDDQDAGHDRDHAIRGLEGIVRNYLKTNPDGEIISVQFVNEAILEAYQRGSVAVSVKAHRDVANHYQLPIVDVGLALAAEIKKGTNSWETYGGVHPKKPGYEFASALINTVFEKSPKVSTKHPVPEVLDPHSYINGRFFDPQKSAWLGGWKFDNPSRELLPMGGIRKEYQGYKALRSDEAGSMLYVDFRGDTLGAFVLAGPDAGILEVAIDKGKWKKIDLFHNYSKGLNYPRSVILAGELSGGYHQAAIRVSEEKNEKSKGTSATILFFEENFSR